MMKFFGKVKKPSGTDETAGAPAEKKTSLFVNLRKRLSALTWKDPRQPGNSLQLELRCREKLVLSENTANMKDVTTIGKASDNDWKLPETDHTAGEHHAKLELTQLGVRLTALEGNHLHVRGEQVTEYRLRKNDRVVIGDSELFAKIPGTGPQQGCDVHRLEVRGGESDGEMIRLEKSPFRIGSAPDNDLVLSSDVVSLHHAEIRIAKNGETWLKDLRSSNGTCVNGERLGTQERMLMDSDEIMLAHFTYNFLDRNVVHTRTYFGRKLLIMGITVLLVMFGFGLFYLSSPPTETVILAVDTCLAHDQFDLAEKFLRKMPDSRGFQRFEKQYQDYLTRIPCYRATYKSMLEFQNNLKSGNWNDAAECFGKLDMNNPLAWNEAHPATRFRIAQINHAKELLDAVLTLENFDTSPNSSKTLLIELWEKLSPQRAHFQASALKDPDYLKLLHQKLLGLIDELDHNVEVLDKIETELRNITQATELKTLDSFIQYLGKIQPTVTGVVRVYIRDLFFMLATIRKNMADLHKNDQALFDLRVADVKPIELISLDDCMKFPRLFDIRMLMEKHLQEQLKARDNWNGIQRLLNRYQLGDGKVPDEIKLFSNEKLIDAVLTLSEITKNPDRRARDYDRIFGERYFYEVIQQTVHTTTNIYASDLIPDMKLVPKCVLLKDLYRGLSEALTWFSLKENQWLLRDRMRTTRDYYQHLLDTRQPILDSLDRIAAANKMNRKYYLARTAYFYFAPATPDMPAKMTEFATEWRKFRLRQQELLSQYDLMDTKKCEQIRDTILSNGIPGDPVFNWMRSMR